MPVLGLVWPGVRVRVVCMGEGEGCSGREVRGSCMQV
jgi:hypothetical protein